MTTQISTLNGEIWKSKNDAARCVGSKRGGMKVETPAICMTRNSVSSINPDFAHRYRAVVTLWHFQLIKSKTSSTLASPARQIIVRRHSFSGQV